MALRLLTLGALQWQNEAVQRALTLYTDAWERSKWILCKWKWLRVLLGAWRSNELLGGDLQTCGWEGEDGSQQKRPSTVTVHRQDPISLTVLMYLLCPFFSGCAFSPSLASIYNMYGLDFTFRHGSPTGSFSPWWRKVYIAPLERWLYSLCGWHTTPTVRVQHVHMNLSRVHNALHFKSINLQGCINHINHNLICSCVHCHTWHSWSCTWYCSSTAIGIGNAPSMPICLQVVNLQ